MLPKPFQWLGCALLLLVSFADPIAAADEIEAFVSIQPQAEFVERLGGAFVKVNVLVPPGQAPETYEPTPKQMVGLSEAQVYFAIGVPFEKNFLPALAGAYPKLKVIDTQEGVPLRPMEECAHDDHDGHHHHAGEPDPHIWLDPHLVKIQAKTICDALVALDPEHAAEYEKNLEAFLAELEGLDKRIAERLKPHQGKALHVFHPAFGYFTDRYGLKQVSIESGGKEPGPKHLAELVGQAKADGVKILFVQPEFATSSAEAIAKEIGGILVVLDPVARDYLKNLESMAEKIATALSN